MKCKWPKEELQIIKTKTFLSIFFSFCQRPLDKRDCGDTYDPVFTSNFQGTINITYPENIYPSVDNKAQANHAIPLLGIHLLDIPA